MEVFYMSEQKRKIGFTVACVNEFARQHNLSDQDEYYGAAEPPVRCGVVLPHILV